MSATVQQPPLYFADRDAFRAWAMQQPKGRYEREDGWVVGLAPERVGHAIIKARAWAALDRAIDDKGLSCQALPNGVTVEVSPGTDHEPDAVVVCGDRLAGNDLVARNPVIVVEVLSPSTASRDASVKLADYFRLASVQHYLMVSADKRLVIHHRRSGEGELLTCLHRTGTIALSPPGLTIDVAELYKGTDLPDVPA